MQYFITCQAGTPVALPESEMNTVLGRFKSYGKQTHELADDDAPAVEAPRRRKARV